MDKHLRFDDPVDAIYCPVIKTLADFRQYRAYDEPLAFYCEGCRTLLDVDPELAHPSNEDFVRWNDKKEDTP